MADGQSGSREKLNHRKTEQEPEQSKLKVLEPRNEEGRSTRLFVTREARPKELQSLTKCGLLCCVEDGVGRQRGGSVEFLGRWLASAGGVQCG